MAKRQLSDFKAELLTRVDIAEIVGEYVRLKPKGHKLWGCCPFHNEKTPSFSVDAEGQFFYCFGCHKGGNALDFVMEIERAEFMDALRMLAERARMELPELTSSGAAKPDAAAREAMLSANRAAAQFFYDTLWRSEGAAALAYLHRRGLSDTDIRRFGLGASESGWDGLLTHLLGKGFSQEVLVSAGLVVKKGDRCFDMFRERAMFPIISGSGQVLGFGGRAISGQEPKYLNTAETPVFNKRQGVYCMNFLRKERGLAHVILVEGYMDAVSLRKAGIPGVVATLGTALTEEQARLIKRYCPEVCISYDGDSAGQKAALRALSIFETVDLPARVIDYPDGQDPDEFVREKGAEGFFALTPEDGWLYRMRRAKDDLSLDTAEGRTEYATRVCGFLKRVPNRIALENYVRQLASETGFSPSVLYSQIGISAPAETRKPKLREQAPPKMTVDVCEQTLICLLMSGLLPDGMIAESDFDSEIAKNLAGILLKRGNPAALLPELSEAERETAYALMSRTLIPDSPEDARREAQDTLRQIRRNRMTARLSEITKRLSENPSADEKLALYAEQQTILAGIDTLDRSKGDGSL